MDAGALMLKVRHLAVFRAVVKTGSVSAAARYLNVSQPAVSKVLRLLESDLGIPLFKRIKGRLFLTTEAGQLMPQVDRLFGDVAAVRQLADEIRDGFRGTIAVASVMTLSATLVALAIERFHRKYPRVRFDIRALSTRNVLDAVVTQQVDVGISDALATSDSIEAVPLCEADVGCIVRDDHRLAHRLRIGPRDLSRETLISFSDETYTGWQLRVAFGEAGVERHINFTVNHTSTAYALVQAGVGVALVDSFPMVFGRYPDLRLLPFRPVVRTLPHALTSIERPVSLVTRKFIGVLQTTVSDAVRGSKGRLKAPSA